MKYINILNSVMEKLCAFLMVLMCLCSFAQVANRFLFGSSFAFGSAVDQNIPQRAPLRSQWGHEACRRLILLQSICFAHWVAMTTCDQCSRRGWWQIL